MKNESMINCVLYPQEKLLIMYDDSYLSDGFRKQYLDEGWTIVKGQRIGKDGKPYIPPPDLPLNSLSEKVKGEDEDG